MEEPEKVSGVPASEPAGPQKKDAPAPEKAGMAPEPTVAPQQEVGVEAPKEKLVPERDLDRLRSSLQKQADEAKKRAVTAETELRLQRQQMLQQMTPDQREAALAQQMGQVQKERDVYQAAWQTGISPEDLMKADSPEELQAIVDSKIREHERETWVKEERERITKEAESRVEKAVSEAVVKARREALEEAGVSKVTTSPGGPGPSVEEEEIAQAKAALRALRESARKRGTTRTEDIVAAIGHVDILRKAGIDPDTIK